MATLVGLKARFNVKAGGHVPFEGGSNVNNGVTIDLIYLNQITVSNDEKIVSLGPAARWIDVSQRLDKMGLAVVGGRAADVGVAGLILGGGISYFTEERGWACDNVKSFEVVLSSGQITNASPTQNIDLFRALRGGGGSNFGIVTRFDVIAFPQGNLWHQMLIHPLAAKEQIFKHFIDLVTKGVLRDNKVHAYFGISHQKILGGFSTLAQFYRSTPPAANTIPEVFRPFQAIPGAFVNTTTVTSLSAISQAIDAPYGTRAAWWDTTIQVESPALFMEIAAAWEASTTKLVAAAGDETMIPFLVFHPITKNAIAHMQKWGGNALGLKANEKPLMMLHLVVFWADKRNDDLIDTTTRDLLEEIKQLANRRGLNRGLVFMNLAGKSQDVLMSYGKESRDRLIATARKWDPKGDLQKLWQGYFQFKAI